MINRLLKGSSSEKLSSILKLSSNKNFDIMEAYQKNEGLSLPKAPANPYKKRPVKLVYDKNEYYNFRLPSEHHFLLSSYDH